MSSVEGMWKFQSGSAAEPSTLRWGGIVVLESGRVFGGDSVMAYRGTYEVDRNEISARVRSWTWNTDLGEVENVFGMTGPIDYVAVLRGRREGDVISGQISPEAQTDFTLDCRMEKISDLP